MKKSRTLAAIAALSLSLPLGASVSAEAKTPVKKLLWSEEFNAKAGTSIDPAKWNFDLGDGTEAGIPGWGNSEREYYVSSAVKHDGKGFLNFTATKMPIGPGGTTTSKNPYMCYYGSACEWTSGKITTFGKVSFQYGQIEARIKMPKGAGMWPAFWMLGTDIKTNSWPNCGEIDIVEAKGVNPKNTYGTVHGPGYSGGDAIGSLKVSSTVNYNTYNTYAIQWQPDQISWLLNDKVYFTLKKSDIGNKQWVFNKQFYLIMNLAVGGQFTGDIDPDIKAGVMSVDWIRYYSLDGVGKVTTN